MILKLPDIPKFLPEKIKKNITRAMSGPETYHGQGCVINSIGSFFHVSKIKHPLFKWV
jgi:hypothetical protein